MQNVYLAYKYLKTNNKLPIYSNTLKIKAALECRKPNICAF